MTNPEEIRDLRRKDRPLTQTEIQARSNKKRQVKFVGTSLSLIYEDERIIYERWSTLKCKKSAFMEAMADYFEKLDNK